MFTDMSSTNPRHPSIHSPARVCLLRCVRAYNRCPKCANFSVSYVAVKIKKPIKTKFRMPVFNWVALKPNQINGTVFNEIDDERILEVRFFSKQAKPFLTS